MLCQAGSENRWSQGEMWVCCEILRVHPVTIWIKLSLQCNKCAKHVHLLSRCFYPKRLPHEVENNQSVQSVECMFMIESSVYVLFCFNVLLLNTAIPWPAEGTDISKLEGGLHVYLWKNWFVWTLGSLQNALQTPIAILKQNKKHSLLKHFNLPFMKQVPFSGTYF